MGNVEGDAEGKSVGNLSLRQHLMQLQSSDEPLPLPSPEELPLPLLEGHWLREKSSTEDEPLPLPEESAADVTSARTERPSVSISVWPWSSPSALADSSISAWKKVSTSAAIAFSSAFADFFVLCFRSLKRRRRWFDDPYPAKSPDEKSRPNVGCARRRRVDNKAKFILRISFTRKRVIDRLETFRRAIRGMPSSLGPKPCKL